MRTRARAAAHRFGVVLAAAVIATSTAVVIGVAPVAAIDCTDVGTKGNDVRAAINDPVVFCGRGGNDSVGTMHGGGFKGGNGKDRIQSFYGGTYLGGKAVDRAVSQYGGTFKGGGRRDVVVTLYGGTFIGGPGNDLVKTVYGGTFRGGKGNDTATDCSGGAANFVGVEVILPC